jgi:hypothetical protein
MARELAVLWAVVTSAAELVLGRSPDETFWLEIANEMVAQFRKMEEQCSRLERPSTRICGLLLISPPDQAQCTDHLDEAAGWLEGELTAWWQVDAELEAL